MSVVRLSANGSDPNELHRKVAIQYSATHRWELREITVAQPRIFHNLHRENSARRVDLKWGPPSSKSKINFPIVAPLWMTAIELWRGCGRGCGEVAVSVECQMNGNRQLASGVCSRNQMKSNGPMRRQR